MLQLRGAPRADARQLLQMLAVEFQPVEQSLQLIAGQQRAPGAGADTRQVQALFATEPVQACLELLLAFGAESPAAQVVVTRGVGCVYHCAFRAAPDHLVEARDGQSGQAYRHLIPRAYIQFFPALQRAESDAADPAFIEVDRLQAQDRRDAPRTADAEIHRLDHGQCLAGWVLPGDCPVWRFGLPAFAGRARALAQHHAIAGERLRFGEPALAPLARLRRVLQRPGVAQAVA